MWGLSSVLDNRNRDSWWWYYFGTPNWNRSQESPVGPHRSWLTGLNFVDHQPKCWSKGPITAVQHCPKRSWCLAGQDHSEERSWHLPHCKFHYFTIDGKTLLFHHLAFLHAISGTWFIQEGNCICGHCEQLCFHWSDNESSNAVTLWPHIKGT